MGKLFYSLLTFIVCAIPLWIWLGVRSVVKPEGFWQEIVLGVVGVYALGGVQILLAIVFVFAIVAILGD